MEKEETGLILENQSKLFASGKTLDINYRIEVLNEMKIVQWEMHRLSTLYI
jgi:hypothetical protein